MYSLANVLSRSAIKSSSSFVSPSLAEKQQVEFSFPISETADDSHVFHHYETLVCISVSSEMVKSVLYQSKVSLQCSLTVNSETYSEVWPKCFFHSPPLPSNLEEPPPFKAFKVWGGGSGGMRRKEGR